jgi:mannose-6-phosphate isomerase-like protein (cupin superfamily)
MSHYGEVLENPVTGERAIVLTDPFEHPDQVLVSHLYVEPGGRVAAAHLHPNLRERFHVISGRVGFQVGAEQRELGPGESAEIPPNTIHDWWQVGTEEASVVVEVDPGIRFVQLVGTMFGLARDGKSTKDGLPKPLQLAVSVSEFRDTIVIASPPPWVQRIVFGLLAPIGRARGLQPYYPRYIDSDVVVEPDPVALALLDADGRLRREG